MTRTRECGEGSDLRTGILIVITRLAVGGAPRHVLTLIRGLDRSRFRATLVAGPPGPEEGSLVEAAQDLGVPFYLLPELRREIHPVHDFTAIWKLFKVSSKTLKLAEALNRSGHSET